MKIRKGFLYGVVAAWALHVGLAAAETTFSGSDSPGSSTNSDAAFDDWSNSLSSFSVDDFAGFNLTDLTTTDGNSFAAGAGTVLRDSDWDSGDVIDAPDFMVVDADPNPAGPGFRGIFTWTLATPSDAFGFFAKDLEDSNASVTVEFVGGQQSQYSFSPLPASGSNLFWGISGLNSQVASVTITSIDQGSLSSWDNFALGTTVPEPTTLALIQMGLIGLCCRMRRVEF